MWQENLIGLHKSIYLGVEKLKQIMCNVFIQKVVSNILHKNKAYKQNKKMVIILCIRARPILILRYSLA